MEVFVAVCMCDITLAISGFRLTALEHAYDKLDYNNIAFTRACMCVSKPLGTIFAIMAS